MSVFLHESKVLTMGEIGGNISGFIQRKTTAGKNAIGKAEVTWANASGLLGWLDLQSGDSKRTNYSTKLEESTHIFLCDFDAGIYSLANEDTRAILKGVVYDVLLIDNPMEMDEQLEIYLRRVGAWDGK
jgi:hypothetical protein